MFTRRMLLGSMAAGGLVACSTPRDLVGLTSDTMAPAGAPPVRSHKIYIATTRAASSEPGVLFSGDRSYDLNFATVDVTVPPNHAVGQVERPRQLPPDPQKHFTIVNPQTFDLDGFYQETKEVTRSMSRGERNLLIWVHGYNNTLSDAILRLTQFVEDTGYQGVPLLFSWASAGQLTGYVYDINSTLIARDSITWLGEALTRSSFENIDMVAHSMGNFLVLEAIRGAQQRGFFDTTGQLRSIILADPDIDYELFVAQVSQLPRSKRRFYVLVSSDDRALGFSSYIARRPRVGHLDPESLTKLGVNAIDLSQVEVTDSTHHTKFAEAPEVVRLVGERLIAGDAHSGTQNSTFGSAVIIGAGGVLQVIE